MACCCKENPDTSWGTKYPPGIELDRQVHQSLTPARRVPHVEFFSYEIIVQSPITRRRARIWGKPSTGTLASQLKVYYTPFVAMLAPHGEEYVAKRTFFKDTSSGVFKTRRASTSLGRMYRRARATLRYPLDRADQER